MNRNLLALIALSLIPMSGFAVTIKLSDLTPATSAAPTDITIVADPAGAAAPKKITFANLKTSLNAGVSSLTAPAAGITITGTGALTMSLSGDLAALEALSTTGYAKRTGSNAWALASQIPWGDLTGQPATLLGYGINDAQPLATALTNLAANTGAVNLSGVTLTLPAAFATLTGSQTLTNKTLTAPVINSPTGIGKTDVGLANVDNTSDASKPVSTATQAALDAKLATNGNGSSLTGITQSQVAGLTTASAPTFSNLVVAASTLAYAGATGLDFSADGFRTVTLTGNVTFTSSNLAAGRSVTIRIIGDASSRTLAFPSWKFIGTAAPTSIAASKTAVLTVTSFGTTDANCVAAYAVEP